MLYPGTQGGDPDVVRAEAQQNVDRMNANQKELKLLLGGAPDTRLMSLARDNPFDDPDTSRLVLIYIVVITILLLVPAINLSGITLSRMRRRMEEIGVRRAFGATRGELLRQVLAENLVVTLMGGVLGLILSYIAVLCMRDWLLNTSMSGYYGVDTFGIRRYGHSTVCICLCVIVLLVDESAECGNSSHSCIAHQHCQCH